MDVGQRSADDPRVEQILSIVARETGVDRALLHPDASIQELGIASIDIVQTVFELEATFDIEIPVVTQQAGAEFTTIGDLLTHVLATLHGKTGSHS
jgi:acyl carrier protein